MEVPQLAISNEELRAKICEHLSPLILDETKVKKLRDVFEDEVEKGIESGLEGSSIQMENTYIPELLDGSEEGDFLALDLGGTNFRVILLNLKKGRIEKEIIEYYSVDEALRVGPGSDLFDFLATCIQEFCSKHSISGESTISLGFTFSFPMIQHALNVGVLVNWTKSFTCPGVIGEDAVLLLNNSLQKIGLLNVRVVAILNDTTGTLVAGSHDYSDCSIGLILGTGTNGAYMEKVERIKRWESGSKEGLKDVIVDPEWGAFGDNGSIDFIKTVWDRDLDKYSLLPASFTYEKYFAGKYLGELARIILLSVYTGGLLSFCPEQLSNVGSISTQQVSEITQDMLNGSTSITESILSKLGASSQAKEGALVLQYICELLAERASILVGIPMAFFLERMDRPTSTIAVTGSLYKHHPTLKAKLETRIKKMTEKKYKFGLCDDGSGKGAGLVAAIAERLARK
ncbi:hexokinase-2 [Eurytemora carolleeae]|uniref:hexokinase-2 n=1 Tax=Eurytemora carolleeae TaxID=1294199 RepID=UPI000C79084B|nr:hexokinase-2 [Eurytemora carolleeae]|eukprot:XP_023323699.1 hexokinase-2-like [Eurytemora affinis]